MNKILSLALATAVLATQANAGNESRMEYFSLRNGLVEVIADFSEDSIYWCGAAVYASKELRVNSPKRIYVWQGPSQAQAKQDETSVKFGFDAPPEAGQVPRFSNSVEIVGNSMSVAQARQTCNERSASG